MEHIAESAVLRVTELLASVGTVEPAASASPAVDLAFTSANGAATLIEIKAYASIRPSDQRLLRQERPTNAIRIVVAPRISDAAARELEAVGLSWAALDGPAHIMVPGMSLRVMRPVAASSLGRSVPAKEQTWTWTPVNRDVAEYLLTRVPRRLHLPAPLALPRTVDVAEVVGHSQGAAAKAMRGLAGQGWLRKEGAARGRGSGWNLVDPTGLLDDWATTAPTSSVEIRVHGLIGEHLDFVRNRLAPQLEAGEWCLAGTSASQLLAPILTANPVLEIGVSRKLARTLDQILPLIDLRRVETGHRLKFVTVPTVSLATRTLVEGIPVTSPARTYADVLGLAGRGPDIASNIRQAELGY